MHRIEFGADGIRGIVGEWPLVSPIAVRIGQALGQFVHRRSRHPYVVIGRDTRPSGPQLLHNLIAGLEGQGVDVINLGLMTTPGVAFLTRRMEADLGVIVSASHSSLEYNGIKLVTRNGLRLQREEEIEVERLIEEYITSAPEYAPVLGEGIDVRNLIELYVWDHVDCCPVESLAGFRVVLDCADGAASRVAPEAFKLLDAEVSTVNCTEDGTNINYHCGSEYARENPHEFAKIVREHGASYGFAFDGDGDRLVVVDQHGRMFDGNDLLFALASFYQTQGSLEENVVVTTELANRGLQEALHQIGVRTVYTVKGDKNLEAAMWGGNYTLGGEVGGNIIINDGHHTAADAVFAALVLAGMLVMDSKTDLAKRVAPVKKYSQVTRSFEIPGQLTFRQVEKIQEYTESIQTKLGGNSRMLFWKSTTEAGVFRVMAEGKRGCTHEEVSEAADDVVQMIRQLVEVKE